MTSLKVISLNIFMGQFLEAALGFLASEAPDVVLLQEVTSVTGRVDNLNVPNCHEALQQTLPRHEMVFAPQWMIAKERDPVPIGNAIMSRLPIVTTSTQYYYNQLVKEHKFDNHTPWAGRLLTAEIDVGGTLVNFNCVHFPWSLHPQITSDQVEAAVKLKNLLDQQENLIVAGDFNTTSDSEVFDIVGSGLTDDRPKNLTNTLHPQLHRLKGSKQLAVDFLYSKTDRLKLTSSHVPVVPISDHLPLVAKYELV